MWFGGLWVHSPTNYILHERGFNISSRATSNFVWILGSKKNSKTAILDCKIQITSKGAQHCEMYDQAAGTADFAAFAGDRSLEPVDSVISLAANVTCDSADRERKTKKTPPPINRTVYPFNASWKLQPKKILHILHYIYTHIKIKVRGMLQNLICWYSTVYREWVLLSGCDCWFCCMGCVG